MPSDAARATPGAWQDARLTQQVSGARPSRFIRNRTTTATRAVAQIPVLVSQCTPQGSRTPGTPAETLKNNRRNTTRPASLAGHDLAGNATPNLLGETALFSGGAVA